MFDKLEQFLDEDIVSPVANLAHEAYEYGIHKPIVAVENFGSGVVTKVEDMGRGLTDLVSHTKNDFIAVEDSLANTMKYAPAIIGVAVIAYIYFNRRT